MGKSQKRKGYNASAVPKAAKELVKKRQDYHCACCGEQHLSCVLETHHIQRRSKGGTNDLNNLIAVCANCHAMIHHYDQCDTIPREYDVSQINF
jgi:5-methylcytosine-specific restriction endonuclease McrA